MWWVAIGALNGRWWHECLEMEVRVTPPYGRLRWPRDRRGVLGPLQCQLTAEQKVDWWGREPKQPH